MAAEPKWLDVALHAVDLLGCPVFPIRGKGDICVRWGSDSSKSPAVLERWSRVFPDATGVGIALDQALYVFDADGPEAVAWCERQLPPTFTVNTSRGRHYYLQVEHGKRLRLLGTGLGKLLGVPKLDGKTKGGYVVAPGSLHSSGVRYATHTDLTVARMPARLARRIGERPVDTPGWSGQNGGGSATDLSAAERAEFAANARWGQALAAEAVDDAARAVQQLEQYLALTDEGWGDAFRDAAVQFGIHLPSGALDFDECVAVLEQAFRAADTWGCDDTHVMRSIRRGLVYGARAERAAWL